MNKFIELDNKSLIRSCWLFWGHVIITWNDPNMSRDLGISCTLYKEAYGE